MVSCLFIFFLDWITRVGVYQVIVFFRYLVWVWFIGGFRGQQYFFFRVQGFRWLCLFVEVFSVCSYSQFFVDLLVDSGFAVLRAVSLCLCQWVIVLRKDYGLWGQVVFLSVVYKSIVFLRLGQGIFVQREQVVIMGGVCVSFFGLVG